MKISILVLAGFLAAPAIALIQIPEARPATAKPLSRLIQFSTDEGTWMSVDISKDGRTLVFDLLGDLYTLPSGGGEAKLLVGGTDFASQPRFSPNGGSIAFVSDRSGSDNVWIAEATGQNSRALTKETGPLMTSPAWSHDGKHVFVTLVGKSAPRTADLWEF